MKIAFQIALTLMVWGALALSSASAQETSTDLLNDPAAPILENLDPSTITPFSPDIVQENLVGTVDDISYRVDARLSPESEPLTGGMIWRVFGTQKTQDGSLPLVATAEGGAAEFRLPPGDYLVHAGFGRAGVARRISVGGTPVNDTFVLEAGGIQLDATLAGEPLKSSDLQFEIYSSEVDERGERVLITNRVVPGQIVRLNAGTYHVVSFYGKINSQVRADLRVEAGKLTRASMEQRGAKIDVKLVESAGGEPIANTQWSIQTESGEEVFSSQSVQPDFILTDGSYVAVAQNAGAVVSREFTVKAGENKTLELLLAN